MKEFTERFKFNPENHGLIGVERECFLTRHGEIAPIAAQVLAVLTDRKRFGFELSACQLEDRIGPSKLDNILEELYLNEHVIKQAEANLDFGRLFTEVASKDMPLDIYPDPTGRYQEISRNLPREILLAACRVIGTHVHIGMKDKETALRIYNMVKNNLDELCDMGDQSGGERLRIYKEMAPDFNPPHYNSWSNYFDEAVKKKFVHDPRKCWHLIRISVHGTIEFRMFGATTDLDKIFCWAKKCHDLCMSV